MAKRRTRSDGGSSGSGRDPSTVARWCGDLDGSETDATEAPGEKERAALERLDGIAGRLSDDAPRMADPAIRFAIADDVSDKRLRLRAIVARTYARAHALTWCRARADEDADTLVRQAAEIERALHTIDPEYEPGADYDDDTAFAWPGWWMRTGAPLALAEHALRATRFAQEDGHCEQSTAVSDACFTLSAHAATLRRTAKSLKPTGRPRDTPRHWFVLRLAEVYALTTGMVPVFDGGTVGHDFDRGGPRKTVNPWHELIDAAFDLTGFRGDGGTTDAALRVVAALGRFNPSLLENFLVDRLRSLTDWSPADGRRSLHDMVYGQLPSVGLEIDLGIDVENPPTSRERAYAPASFAYRGRTHRL